MNEAIAINKSLSAQLRGFAFLGALRSRQVHQGELALAFEAGELVHPFHFESHDEVRPRRLRVHPSLAGLTPSLGALDNLVELLGRMDFGKRRRMLEGDRPLVFVPLDLERGLHGGVLLITASALAGEQQVTESVLVQLEHATLGTARYTVSASSPTASSWKTFTIYVSEGLGFFKTLTAIDGEGFAGGGRR